MLLWIQSVNSEHFLRAVEYLLVPGIPCPTAGVGQLLRFGQISLTSHQSLFVTLALRQIEHERNTLVTALFKCCATNQHGHTAAVFSDIFLFERLEPAATFLLFDLCVLPLAPFGRRQVRPPYAARKPGPRDRSSPCEEIVIGLNDAAIDIPDENPDYIGVHQAPNLRFAFCEIAVGLRKRQRALLLGFEQAHVFDRDHRLAGEVLEKRDLLGGEWSDFPSPD